MGSVMSTKKNRVARLLVQAKATAQVYRALAERLNAAAYCLEASDNTEWSGFPTLTTEDLARAIKAGIVLELLIQEMRK